MLPKFGPLRVLELKTPTPETERMFEESFNLAVSDYRRLLKEESEGKLRLPNVNFDVGKETEGGKYRLNDNAHAQLLHALAQKKFECLSPDLRQELLSFFASAEAPYAFKKDPKTWDRVQADLQALKATGAETAQAPEPSARVKPSAE